MMTLEEFLLQTQADVDMELSERLNSPTEGDSIFSESVFTEIVMQHMSDIGMTFEFEVCHYQAKVRNANLRLSGYAISEEGDQLDLFVSIYGAHTTVTSISDTEIKKAAEQCLRFLAACADGKLASTMDESNDAYMLVRTIQECYPNLNQIRIYILTDHKSKAKNFKSRDVNDKTVRLEVMDIERLFRHLSEGKPRDELVVNFEELAGDALPCVYVPGEMQDYDYALAVIPGEVLYVVYEKYGARLLEANVRSFLSVTGKVNRGIRDTLRSDPERFMAYNNGIVIVADEIRLGTTSSGGPGILWIKGMQVVNGGQTTASIYFTKKKDPNILLRRVRVPAKIVILRRNDSETEEMLISDISKYANSQNSVKQSDLLANKPFHVELEKLSNTIYCPDGHGRWFYERASGSYNTMLAREGTTPAKLKTLRQTVVPSSRKITKTELAKYLNAWDQKPHLVSQGAQKNFAHFMDSIDDDKQLLDASTFKTIVAKAILYKQAQKTVRPMFSAFQGNVTTYLISLLANKVGDKFDFDRVWLQQDISPELRAQLQKWALEVNDILDISSKGRMISEWSKKSECWTTVASATYSECSAKIPELRHVVPKNTKTSS